MANVKLDGSRVTVQGRLRYPNVFKPRSVTPGGEEKYNTTILIPKTDTNAKQAIDKALKEAENAGMSGKWNGAKPPVVPNPVWDGDGVKANGDPFDDVCKGHWVITANAKADYPPKVVDRTLQPVMNQSEIYSGVWANVAINFFPYAFAGKKGIGAGLGNIQKVKDDQALAGERSITQDFEPIEDDLI